MSEGKKEIAYNMGCIFLLRNIKLNCLFVRTESYRYISSEKYINNALLKTKRV